MKYLCSMPGHPLVQSELIELSISDPEMYARAYMRLAATADMLDLHERLGLPIEIKVYLTPGWPARSFRFTPVKSWDLILA
jgi:hypothetical protein